MTSAPAISLPSISISLVPTSAIPQLSVLLGAGLPQVASVWAVTSPSPASPAGTGPNGALPSVSLLTVPPTGGGPSGATNSNSGIGSGPDGPPIPPLGQRLLTGSTPTLAGNVPTPTRGLRPPGHPVAVPSGPASLAVAKPSAGVQAAVFPNIGLPSVLLPSGSPPARNGSTGSSSSSGSNRGGFPNPSIGQPKPAGPERASQHPGLVPGSSSHAPESLFRYPNGPISGSFKAGMAGTAEARTARVIGPIDVLTPGTTKLATLAPSLNGHSSAYTGGPTTSMTAPTTASSRVPLSPPAPNGPPLPPASPGVSSASSSASGSSGSGLSCAVGSLRPVLGLWPSGQVSLRADSCNPVRLLSLLERPG